MKLVTFNIRGDFGIDGENNFDCRKPLILRRIQAQQPDVIGFQEVMPHVQRWLRQNLPGYTVVGCGRKADYSDEAMTLAIRNETAELLGVGEPTVSKHLKKARQRLRAVLRYAFRRWPD